MLQKLLLAIAMQHSGIFLMERFRCGYFQNGRWFYSSEKLQEKLGKLWSGLDKQDVPQNGENADEKWESLFGNVRQMLIRAASEPDFPIDFNFGETPFADYARCMKRVDPGGKLKKMVVRAGYGDIIQMNSVVYIIYRAYLEYEEYPFMSSYTQSPSPKRYQLGSGSLCGGFEAAMSTMKVGEKAHFLLSPEIAFGKTGCPPAVPPDAEILLEMELCDIVRHDHRSTNKENEYNGVMKTVEDLQEVANECYQNGNFVCALINYRKAENLLTVIKCSDKVDEIHRKEVLLNVIVNQMITYVSGNKTGTRPQEAVSAALRAFQHVPAEAALSSKLKFNLAKAYILLKEEEKAFQLLKEARKLEPRNQFIKNLYYILEKQINEKLENETKCWNRARKRFPEHDRKGQYIEFLKGSVKNDLENYLENPTSNIGMPWNYTSDERLTLRREAEKMNLVYEEYKSHPANVLISIHKRGYAMLVTEKDEILHQPKELVSSDDDEEEEEFIGWDVDINDGGLQPESCSIVKEEESARINIKEKALPCVENGDAMNELMNHCLPKEDDSLSNHSGRSSLNHFIQNGFLLNSDLIKKEFYDNRDTWSNSSPYSIDYDSTEGQMNYVLNKEDKFVNNIAEKKTVSYVEDNGICVIIDSDEEETLIPQFTDQPGCSGIGRRNNGII